jgi:hypothetical protein
MRVPLGFVADGAEHLGESPISGLFPIAFAKARPSAMSLKIISPALGKAPCAGGAFRR